MLTRLPRSVSSTALIAATVCVLQACQREEEPAAVEVVRPVKLFTVAAPSRGAGRTYPGTVRANEQAVLAFQVAGRLIEYPVDRGMLLKQGELIGSLDPRDYQNNLNTAQASLDYEENRLERVRVAVENDAVTELELVEQQAKFDAALAQRDIAQKALDDTRLTAPYDGVVVDKIAEQFEDLTKTQPVVIFQSTDFVKIEIDVPEADVITVEGSASSEPDNELHDFSAEFPNLPGRTFDLRLAEYVAEADAVTRTYRAQLVMPSPEDALILPGMTASVRWIRGDSETEASHLIPMSATVPDGDGFRVWVIDGGSMTATSRPVTLGQITGDDQVQVLDGLAQGEVIAAAGVHWIREGMKVRSLDESVN